jgi:hypothetical protein
MTASLTIATRKGIDGNWSTTTFLVGGDSTDTRLQLLISTALSETWVISAGGCSDCTSDPR